MTGLGILTIFSCIFVVGTLIWPVKAISDCRVVEQDNPGIGVECEFHRVSPAGETRPIGATDEDGYYKGTIQCERGERVRVKPVGSLYYTREIRCPIREALIKIQSVTIVTGLKNDARDAEKKGEVGKAALLYNEVAARASYAEDQTGNKAERKVYELIGRALNVGKATQYDPSQKRHVASTELIEAVKEFQSKEGVGVSGKIDYATLKAAAGFDIGDLINTNK